MVQFLAPPRLAFYSFNANPSNVKYLFLLAKELSLEVRTEYDFDHPAGRLIKRYDTENKSVTTSLRLLNLTPLNFNKYTAVTPFYPTLLNLKNPKSVCIILYLKSPYGVNYFFRR